MNQLNSDFNDQVRTHISGSITALSELSQHTEQLTAWAQSLYHSLRAGQRLLVAGNGGSAAEAQHLTAELVGRFDGERAAFSALALSSESSSVTAISNDYGFEHVFARQVEAHGRAGDILLVLSTSGASPNLLQAVSTARKAGLSTWALTGATPNPLATACDQVVSLSGSGANVQEAQLAAVHILCLIFDSCVAASVEVPATSETTYSEARGGL